MKKETEKWLISVCGLNCIKCDMYQAAHGDKKLQKEIVEWFKTKRNQTIRPEQIKCKGCRGSLDNHWSSDCKMMLCARKKGMQYCFECEEFPCEEVNKFASDGVPHHKKTVENAKRMKEIGIEAWIKEQERGGQYEFCP